MSVATPEADTLAALAGAIAPYMGENRKAVGYRHDIGGTLTTGYSHGPGGNFSVPGVAPAVFHTVVGNRGILGLLPVAPRLDTNPTYQVMTGVQGTTGAEKEEPCDDAPVAGLIKSCLLTSVFGRYERSTPDIEINRLGQQVDRADPMDLTVVGSPIHQSGLFATGPGDPSIPGDLLQNEISRKMWELGVSLHRLISQQLWTGNPTNNAVGGGYEELTGFDLLISTSHVDARTAQPCPSIDSDVKNFNYRNVTDEGAELVTHLSALYHFVKDLAIRTGVMPVNWVIAMKPELFWAITEVWPCAYLTYRCPLPSGGVVNVDGAEQVRMRDELRAGSFLIIDGDRIPVVQDDGIPESTSTDDGNVPEGCFSSDIYLIPLSVTGGRSVTFLEHFQYQNPAIADALAMGALGRIEGPWITWPRQTNLCVAFQTKIEPRLVMRTPWLAGRLNNVVACPPQRTRSPFPSDTYFVDGGTTTRTGPSYSSLWNQ
ncbi:hypothetical protein LCGC14_1655860 [marine sediment metagenome]|uniref:Uncharacterized protein n=1 Tax=marine sediment metagenome TaxID=412755 RepID=A0A0F9II10_9ZZZZ